MGTPSLREGRMRLYEPGVVAGCCRIRPYTKWRRGSAEDAVRTARAEDLITLRSRRKRRREESDPRPEWSGRWPWFRAPLGERGYPCTTGGDRRAT